MDSIFEAAQLHGVDKPGPSTSPYHVSHPISTIIHVEYVEDEQLEMAQPEMKQPQMEQPGPSTSPRVSSESSPDSLIVQTDMDL